MILVLISSCGGEPEQSSNLSDKPDEKIHYLTRHGLPVEIIEGYVAFKPPTFYAQGKLNFIYELNILNNHRQSFELNEVAVFDVENDNVPIAVFDSLYLNNEFDRPGLLNTEETRTLKGGQFGIVHLNLTMDKKRPLPKQIFHRLGFGLKRENGTQKKFPMDVALIDFPKPTELTMPLPFKKGLWFYGATSHKASRVITEGKATYAQRFALDWVYLEEDGTMRKGEPEKNESYPTYGIEVMAVADGVVVDVKDSIPENIPGSEEMPVRLTRETGSGNSITIAISDTIHAHYAHFIPKSLKVKVGDKVTKGQVIALLGNSGSSTGPHLHFHLETASKYPLGGEGIPYHLEGFDQYISFEDEEWAKWDSLFLKEKILLPETPFAIRSNELPIANGFIRFD